MPRYTNTCERCQPFMAIGEWDVWRHPSPAPDNFDLESFVAMRGENDERWVSSVPEIRRNLAAARTTGVWAHPRFEILAQALAVLESLGQPALPEHTRRPPDGIFLGTLTDQYPHDSAEPPYDMWLIPPATPADRVMCTVTARRSPDSGPSAAWNQRSILSPMFDLPHPVAIARQRAEQRGLLPWTFPEIAREQISGEMPTLYEPVYAAHFWLPWGARAADYRVDRSDCRWLGRFDSVAAGQRAEYDLYYHPSLDRCTALGPDDWGSSNRSRSDSRLVPALREAWRRVDAGWGVPCTPGRAPRFAWNPDFICRECICIGHTDYSGDQYDLYAHPNYPSGGRALQVVFSVVNQNGESWLHRATSTFTPLARARQVWASEDWGSRLATYVVPVPVLNATLLAEAIKAMRPHAKTGTVAEKMLWNKIVTEIGNRLMQNGEGQFDLHAWRNQVGE